MFTIVIQAGGQSRRMGQDKALLPFLGQPLIQRVLDRVTPISQEILITTNQPDNYRFLGIPLIADAVPGRGALGGLYTALNAASFPLVAVIACDMPFASPELLAAQRDILIHSPFDVAIPKTDHGLEPFHAVYRKDPCRDYAQKALDEGLWRADAWFGLARLRIMPPEELERYDPRGLAFLNVNTPEELQQAEQMAKEL